ncbi:MAG: hypothetical protein J5590_09995 [Clostridia bacterium]|nr:hypothetical protein [Clostridia bacterium]
MAGRSKHDLKYNSSGCLDITAYEALRRVQKEERRQIISEMSEIARRHGYRIVSRIKLKEMDT